MEASARLIEVTQTVGLWDDFDVAIRINITLERPLNSEQIRQLVHLVESWGFVGAFAPLIDVSHDMDQSMNSRETVIRYGGMKGSVEVETTAQKLIWDVEWGAVDAAWMDILLNCLENYHLTVAPIRRVSLERPY